MTGERTSSGLAITSGPKGVRVFPRALGEDIVDVSLRSLAEPVEGVFPILGDSESKERWTEDKEAIRTGLQRRPFKVTRHLFENTPTSPQMENFRDDESCVVTKNGTYMY